MKYILHNPLPWSVNWICGYDGIVLPQVRLYNVSNQFPADIEASYWDLKVAYKSRDKSSGNNIPGNRDPNTHFSLNSFLLDGRRGWKKGRMQI